MLIHAHPHIRTHICSFQWRNKQFSVIKEILFANSFSLAISWTLFLALFYLFHLQQFYFNNSFLNHDARIPLFICPCCRRGTIITTFIVCYALTSFISGYVSGGLYSRSGGLHTTSLSPLKSPLSKFLSKFVC